MPLENYTLHAQHGAFDTEKIEGHPEMGTLFPDDLDTR